MKNPRKYISCTASALLLASSLAAGAANAESFTASFTTNEILIPQPHVSKCPAKGLASGVGQASVFGGAQLISSDCVVSPDGGPTLIFTNGRMVLSDGDVDKERITATYQGSFSFSEVLPSGHMIYRMNPDATFVITGGTGRYARASGSGSLSGYEVMSPDPTVPAQGNITATGLITY
jgi:hypothetical protein